MKVRSVWLLVIAALLWTGTARAEEPGPVVIVPLKTNVSQAQFFFLRRAIKEAERQNARALVIDMETYGGEVKAAINNMDALLKTTVPTYTYVNPRALSAGALIALATQKIYVAPTAVIGAAAPVLATGQDVPGTASEKVVSALSATARAAAQESGHNPDLADAFIRKEAELKIGDITIDKPDSLLTLSASEAVREINGKPVLAVGTASSLDAMLQAAGLSGPVQRMTPSGFEHLAIWITALAPVLLLGGIVGAYIEFKTPGFGIPGILSAICFGLYFTGHYIAGLTGWGVAICFALGVLLVISELFVHPGTILPGVAGFLLMIGSLLWAMIDRYPSQPIWPSGEMLVRPLVNFSIAVALAAVAAVLLAKILPRTSVYRRIVLTETMQTSAGVMTVSSQRPGPAVGATGTAKTTLRPSGKAEIGGELVDVVSQGEWIDEGGAVRIVAVEGARVVVEPARVAWAPPMG